MALLAQILIGAGCVVAALQAVGVRHRSLDLTAAALALVAGGLFVWALEVL